MQKRLAILLLGVALGLAAKGVKYLYDVASAPSTMPAPTSAATNAGGGMKLKGSDKAGN
jgi:hypothetical protein